MDLPNEGASSATERSHQGQTCSSCTKRKLLLSPAVIRISAEIYIQTAVNGAVKGTQ